MAIRLDSLEEQFLMTVRNNNLITKGDKIVVGVSGGPDSIALLYLLIKYQTKLGIESLSVAHINHLIRTDSTDDEHFVENYCKKNNVPFYALRAEVEKIAKENKRGTEEQGRIIRYQFFDEVMSKTGSNKLAIAHNKNDKVETVILNMIRGSGTKGLEGIRPYALDDQSNMKIIRPLIDIEKKDILDFANKNRLEPRIDSTNSQNIYRRNIIRNEIIPKLQEINPNIVDTISRTSDIIAEENVFVKTECDREYKILSNRDCNIISFNLKEFNSLDEIIKSELVFMAIEELVGNRKNVQKINVDDVVKLASRNISGKFTKINNKVSARVNKGKLEIYLC